MSMKAWPTHHLLSFGSIVQEGLPPEPSANDIDRDGQIDISRDSYEALQVKTTVT